MDDCMFGGAVRPARERDPSRNDLYRLARATGENDVMTPAKFLGDGCPSLLKQRPRPTAFGVRRTGIGPAIDPPRKCRPRFGNDRGGGCMVEIESGWGSQKPRIPADCHMNERSYIGRAAAAHPSASATSDTRAPNIHA